MESLIVVGGGLAGCEAAWQAAQRGVKVQLFEMRPGVSTGAHITERLAELVCSNSLGSNLPDRASGLLKEEARQLGSMLLEVAEEAAIPAGGALAVDREVFAQAVTDRIGSHPNIQLIREEVCVIPDGPAVIASGPLTSDRLASSIMQLTGEGNLFFFDAIAPIVQYDSIDQGIAFRASRYAQNGEAEGDYINCPFTKTQYETFVNELAHAERIQLRTFESDIVQGVKAGAGQFFEGCLPVEVLANRGERSLAFGPMRPVGLVDPHTGRRPYAVVQLRQDNLAGSLYNLVGFQTNLTYPEQKRVFRLIPGLEHAEFARYGQMHRNSYITSPKLLFPTLQFKQRENLFFAGQITGVEGYMGNIATGLLAGINASRLIKSQPLLTLPPVMMLGALCGYITQAEAASFQPMKANFGILPPLDAPGKMSKRERAMAYSQRAVLEIEHLRDTILS